MSIPVWLILAAGLLAFSPLLEGGTTHMAVMAIRLLILSLFAWYVLQGVMSGRLEYAFPRGTQIASLYLLVAAANTWFSPYSHQSLQWFIVLTSYAVLLYLFVFFINEWDHSHKLLSFLVALCLLEAVWTIVQWWLGSVRPSGTFFNPNFLAGYVVVGWMVVLAGLCYSPLRLGCSRLGWAGRLAWVGTCLAILGLLLTAIAVTGSRASLATLLAGTGLILLLRFGQRGVWITVLLIVMAMSIPNPIRDRVFSEHTYNSVTYARWDMWKSAARQIQDDPLGVGLGLYQYTFPRYSFPVEGQITRYTMVAQTPHNEYLQMGVEMGIASVPLFVCGLIIVFSEAAWVLRQRLRRWQRGIMVGATGGATTLLIHAAVDSNLHEPALAIVLVLCLAIMLAGRKLSAPSTRRTSSVVLQPRWLWGGLAVLAGIIIVGSVVRMGLAWSYANRGELASTQSRYVEAIKLYQSAVALDPSKAMYHSALSGTFYKLYRQRGDYETAFLAIDELEIARNLNPLDGRISGELGRVFVALASRSPIRPRLDGQSDGGRMSWLQRAEAAFREAVEAEPFTASYWFELGKVQAELDQVTHAQSAVQKAVELEPNFLPAREWLARLCLREGQREEAMRQYLEIVERQRQFAAIPHDLIAQRFLKADTAALWDALEKTRFGI